jgi:hypothetical protein
LWYTTCWRTVSRKGLLSARMSTAQVTTRSANLRAAWENAPTIRVSEYLKPHVANASAMCRIRVSTRLFFADQRVAEAEEDPWPRSRCQPCLLVCHEHLTLEFSGGETRQHCSRPLQNGFRPCPSKSQKLIPAERRMASASKVIPIPPTGAPPTGIAKLASGVIWLTSCGQFRAVARSTTAYDMPIIQD